MTELPGAAAWLASVQASAAIVLHPAKAVALTGRQTPKRANHAANERIDLPAAAVRSGQGLTVEQAGASAPVDARLVQTAMLDAVLAGDGLSAVAKLAADAVDCPVAIVIPRLAAAVCSDASQPSHVLAELRHWVSEIDAGRPSVVPSFVVQQAPVRSRGGFWGAVALLEGGSGALPFAPDYLDAAVVGALMEMAIQDAREETEQRVLGAFLEELRSRRDLGGAEIVRRAKRLGCDLSRGGIVICSTVLNERSHLVLATIADECPEALAQQLEGTESDPRARVYAVVPAGGGAGSLAGAEAAARQLAERLRRQAIVGLSSFRADPASLPEAIVEAELMLEVLRYSQESVVDDINDNGTYKLLFRVLASHPEEVRTFYDSSIAEIVRYDDRYNTELVRTLQAYLDSNCNMNATAAALFAHRHTVAYRLDRVHELTALDPMLTEHRERLGLGLKIKRILAPKAHRSHP